MTLDQIIDRSIRPPIETVLHIVSKFQFHHVCFQKEEASTNVGVINNIVSNADTISMHVLYFSTKPSNSH